MAAKFILRDKLTQELRAVAPSEPVVPTAKSKKLLDTLVWFHHHDEMYSVTQLDRYSISWHESIEYWLGYSDVRRGDELAWNHMSGYTHLFLREYYQAQVDAAMLLFARRKAPFLKWRFVISVPFQRADKQWMLVKHMGMPFESTTNGDLGNFVHSYFVIFAYKGEHMRLRLFNSNIPLEEESKAVRAILRECINPVFRNYLLPQDFQLLDLVRTMRENGEALTSTNIAKFAQGLRVDQLDGASIRKYLNNIRKTLLNMLKAGYTPKEREEAGPFFLDKMDWKGVVDYFEQAGILSLLQPLQESS